MRKTLTETETIASEKRPPFPANICGVADPQANNHELGMKKKTGQIFSQHIFFQKILWQTSRETMRDQIEIEFSTVAFQRAKITSPRDESRRTEQHRPHPHKDDATRLKKPERETTEDV
jgi:hypothetical protein